MNGSLYSIFTLLIVLTAIFSYINFRFFKLPATIGIMVISLLCSVVILGLGKFNPHLMQQTMLLVTSVNFERLLMKVMLSFLLFAGAIHVNIQSLKKEIVSITIYSTFGVIISTALIGIGMFYVFQLFGFSIPLIYCFLFGALISPTDPIAVLGILKEANIPSSIEIKITGESLFNDGIGVVIFASLLDIALMGTDKLSIMQVAGLFLREAGGGIIWGLVLGYAGYYLLRSIDHYEVEVLITIAMVMGGYLFASYLHISGPLAMVVAGIITGNKGKEEAMSALTRDYVSKFWDLIDNILNAVLFLLIGFEMIAFSFDQKTVWLGLISILVVLFSRFISIFLPTLFLSIRMCFEKNLTPILVWGGLRGGISVALALSLPRGEYRDVIISITYIIVVFSIVVQGLTVGRLARKLNKSTER